MYSTRLIAVTIFASIGVVLSGCSLLNSGPARDGSGQVTEATTISARDLLTGDCFTFNSSDGAIVEEVTVKPCTQKHDYVVLGQGTLWASLIKAAGSLQNAVSAHCADTFEKFKTASADAGRPKQEFLVFAESDDPDSDQAYSCISTDPDQKGLAVETAITKTPSPTTVPTP